MATPADFSKSFGKLLDAIPKESTLAQWQYLYREVIFSMGMRILNQFSQDVLGPDPFAEGHGGGIQPGAPSPPPPHHVAGAQPGPAHPPAIAAGRAPWYQPAGHGPGYQPAVILALTALDLSPCYGKEPP